MGSFEWVAWHGMPIIFTVIIFLLLFIFIKSDKSSSKSGWQTVGKGWFIASDDDLRIYNQDNFHGNEPEDIYYNDDYKYSHEYNNRFSDLQCTCIDLSEMSYGLGPDGEKWYNQLVAKQEKKCPYHRAINNHSFNNGFNHN